MAFKNLSWLMISSLCLEFTALILVTLVLVCPSPLQHSNVSMFVIQPTNATSNMTVSFAPGLGPSSSTVDTNSSSSTSLMTPNATSTSTSTKSTPSSSSSTLSTTNDAPSTTTSKASSSDDDNSVDASVQSATKLAGDDGLPRAAVATFPTSTPAPRSMMMRKRVAELERIIMPGSNNTSSSSGNTVNATTAAAIAAAEKILFRGGPLGSCSRTKDDIESCTDAKLSSNYDYGYIQSLGYDTSALPTGMTTYPIILLVLVVALTIVVMIKALACFCAMVSAADSQSSSALANLSSPSTQKYINYFVILVDIVLAVSTGVKRNQITSSLTDFNTAAASVNIKGTQIFLQATTSNAFGFVWISVVLLLISFICIRLFVRRQAALNQAKEQLIFIDGLKSTRSAATQPQPSSSSYSVDAQPMTTRIIYSDDKEEASRYPPSSNYHLPYTQSASTIVVPPPSVKYASSEADSTAFQHYRYGANPYPSYEKGWEQVEMNSYPPKMQDPIPSYHSLDQREKERIYMAELRRQRTVA